MIGPLKLTTYKSKAEDFNHTKTPIIHFRPRRRSTNTKNPLIEYRDIEINLKHHMVKKLLMKVTKSLLLVICLFSLTRALSRHGYGGHSQVRMVHPAYHHQVMTHAHPRVAYHHHATFHGHGPVYHHTAAHRGFSPAFHHVDAHRTHRPVYQHRGFHHGFVRKNHFGINHQAHRGGALNHHEEIHHQELHHHEPVHPHHEMVHHEVQIHHDLHHVNGVGHRSQVHQEFHPAHHQAVIHHENVQPHHMPPVHHHINQIHHETTIHHQNTQIRHNAHIHDQKNPTIHPHNAHVHHKSQIHQKSQKGQKTPKTNKKAQIQNKKPIQQKKAQGKKKGSKTHPKKTPVHKKKSQHKKKKAKTHQKKVQIKKKKNQTKLHKNHPKTTAGCSNAIKEKFKTAFYELLKKRIAKEITRPQFTKKAKTLRSSTGFKTCSLKEINKLKKDVHISLKNQCNKSEKANFKKEYHALEKAVLDSGESVKSLKIFRARRKLLRDDFYFCKSVWKKIEKEINSSLQKLYTCSVGRLRDYEEAYTRCKIQYHSDGVQKKFRACKHESEKEVVSHKCKAVELLPIRIKMNKKFRKFVCTKKLRNGYKKAYKPCKQQRLDNKNKKQYRECLVAKRKAHIKCYKDFQAIEEEVDSKLLKHLSRTCKNENEEGYIGEFTSFFKNLITGKLTEKLFKNKVEKTRKKHKFATCHDRFQSLEQRLKARLNAQCLSIKVWQFKRQYKDIRKAYLASKDKNRLKLFRRKRRLLRDQFYFCMHRLRVEEHKINQKLEKQLKKAKKSKSKVHPYLQKFDFKKMTQNFFQNKVYLILDLIASAGDQKEYKDWAKVYRLFTKAYIRSKGLTAFPRMPSYLQRATRKYDISKLHKDFDISGYAFKHIDKAFFQQEAQILALVLETVNFYEDYQAWKVVYKQFVQAYFKAHKQRIDYPEIPEFQPGLELGDLKKYEQHRGQKGGKWYVLHRAAKMHLESLGEGDVRHYCQEYVAVLDNLKDKGLYAEVKKEYQGFKGEYRKTHPHLECPPAPEM